MTGWVTVNLSLGNSVLNGDGYIFGFRDSLFSASSIIDKLTFSTESFSALSATLPVSVGGCGAFSSSAYGYAVAGFQSASVSDTVSAIQRLDFSAVSTSTISATIGYPPYKPASVNSNSTGYVAGGVGFVSQNPTPCYSAIGGLLFSSETSLGIIANITVAREFVVGVNSSSRGYFAGGYNDITYYSTIDGIQFSNNTIFGLSATLSSPRAGVSGANSTSKGYFAGGSNANLLGINSIEALNFSTETISTTAASMQQNTAYAAGLNSTTTGYFVQGGTGSDGLSAVTNTSGINFSTETSHNLAYGPSGWRWAAEGTQSGGIL